MPPFRKLLLVLGVAALPAGIGLSIAQQPFVVEAPSNASFANYGAAGNAAAARLRRLPAKMFTFDRASLRDVLRYLADEAGLPFVGLPETETANRRLVTFTMEASPFTALESVCSENDVRLHFENGVWFMRSVDEQRERRIKEEEENKLVGIAYTLRYDPVDFVDFRDGSSGSQAASGSGGGASSSAGGGGAQASTPNLPLQNSQRVFASKAPRIVNEIRVMLGLQPISYNEDGTVQGETAVAGRNVESTSIVGPSPEGAASTVAGPLAQTYVPPQVPQVIYNSDTNTLWVVATRAQHKWVEDYLLAVDRPQDLIAIEVKFFETTKDPSKELGINWARTMQGGYNVGLQDLSFSSGSVEFSRVNAPTEGSTLTITPSAPYSAVLTAKDVNIAIQAFMNDRKTSMVQYPRVLTVNNREVAITSAENTPINAGVSQVATGSTAVPVGTLGYLPVGTQINILPKTLGKDMISMTVAITVSSVIGEREIDLGTGTSSYPVTSQRIYNASLQVNSGYTLAVGGLEAVDDRRDNNGIPLLQDIPIAGELFKSKNRTRNKKNLIVFITPRVIPSPTATRGISETPEATIPVRPDDPTPPVFTPDGKLVGGWAAVGNALAWLEFQAKLFRQINEENRTDKDSIKRLRAVIATARMLSSDLSITREEDPNPKPELIMADDRAVKVLTELNRILAVAQDNLM